MWIRIATRKVKTHEKRYSKTSSVIYGTEIEHCQHKFYHLPRAPHVFDLKES